MRTFHQHFVKYMTENRIKFNLNSPDKIHFTFHISPSTVKNVLAGISMVIVCLVFADAKNHAVALVENARGK